MTEQSPNNLDWSDRDERIPISEEGRRMFEKAEEQLARLNPPRQSSKKPAKSTRKKRKSVGPAVKQQQKKLKQFFAKKALKKNWQGFPRNKCAPEKGYRGPEENLIYRPLGYGKKDAEVLKKLGKSPDDEQHFCHNCMLRPCVVVEYTKELDDVLYDAVCAEKCNRDIQWDGEAKLQSILDDLFGKEYGRKVFPSATCCLQSALRVWYPKKFHPKYLYGYGV